MKHKRDNKSKGMTALEHDGRSGLLKRLTAMTRLSRSHGSPDEALLAAELEKDFERRMSELGMKQAA